eukprot:scaffold1638_cov258-Pinguiococcus_pyrenoidosus.AAC.96
MSEPPRLYSAPHKLVGVRRRDVAKLGLTPLLLRTPARSGGKLLTYSYGPAATVDVGTLLAAEGKPFADALAKVVAGKAIQTASFSYQQWYDSADAAEKTKLYAEMADRFLDGTLDVWVEEHPLHDFDFAKVRASDPYYVRQVILNKMTETPEDLVAQVKASL